MVHGSRRFLFHCQKLVDFGCLVLSLALIVDLLRIEFALKQLLNEKVYLYDVCAAITFFVSWHLILRHKKLYVSRRLSTIEAEISDIVIATSMGTIFLFVFSNIFFETKLVTWTFLLLFWLNINALMILSRVALRYFQKQLRQRGLDVRNLIVAGTHKRAMLFAADILARPELGYNLLGFMDDAGERTVEFDRSGYNLVCSIEDFATYLREQVVDEVMICLPIKSHYQQAVEIAATCEEHGVLVRFLSDIFNPKTARSSIQRFQDHSIITFYTGQMFGTGILVKRVMDIFISLLLILALSPLFLIAALLIKASSKGPVFYVQKRLGFNKRYFSLYKFRTMYPDAEQRQAELEHLNEVQGPVFKIRNDPRITPVGRFLRMSSIDELPQLVNVLKGEMSLVGPRPLPIRDYKGFNQDWHRRRFSVRPGITCLWQISGRSDITFDRWMELDMEYIDNWSLWLDTKILMWTVRAVLKGSGAA